VVRRQVAEIPEEDATWIDGLVACGADASAGDVLRAGLEALRHQDGSAECHTGDSWSDPPRL